MDIVTLAAVRKGGGSGGDVTKQYVDEHLALKADKTETAEYPISSTTTGINPSITDSADGYVQNVKVYGRSDVSKNKAPYTLETIQAENTTGTWTNNVYTIGTATITVELNANGDVIGIKKSGTISSTFNFVLTRWNIPVGLYLLSGGIDDAIAAAVYDNGVAALSHGPGDVSYNTGTTSSQIALYVVFGAGDSRTLDIFPMLRLATETDPTFEPYFSGIHGIGEDGELEITTANSDSSESSTATLTTGLPYCGIPVETGETYTDEQGQKWLADTADVEGVVKRCYKVTFDGSADEGWLMPFSSLFTISAPLALYKASEITTICDLYTPAPNTIIWSGMPDKSERITKDSSGNIEILITDTSYTTLNDFKTYLASNPITVIYELAIPTTQELTTAEKSALRNLRTYNPTTNVTVTDDPTADIGYLLNTDNGQAVADVQTDLQGQINNIPAWLTDIPENHKNIFRGKNLGNSVSAAQLTAIADGSFDDLYIGDYWEIPVTIDGTTVSNKWRIADFDYFFHNGTDKHHAVIVPDNTLYTAQMGGTITYGYYQSTMFTTNLNKGRTAIANAFPDMIISYEYNDIIGQTSTKYDCTVELMTLSSLTGVYSDYIHTTYLPVLPQMSLFRIMPDFIGANPNDSGHGAGFLTQTVKTSSYYWVINALMKMMEMTTSQSYGVRPFFLLGDAGT